MAKKKSAPKASTGSFTSDSPGKISNAKGKWGQVRKLAKKVQEKAKVLSYGELKDLAREYNAKLPKGSKKRINLRQSGEKISAALGIKPVQEKKSKPQPTEKKPPAKTGEAWGKTLDKVGKSKLGAEAKGDFRKQVKEAAKKLVADKPVEIEKPAPKEVIDGLVKVVEAKKKEIKSKVGKDKSTPDDYTKSELQRMATEAKIPGRSKLTTKQALFDALGLGKKKDEEIKKPEPLAEVKKSKKGNVVTGVEKPKKTGDVDLGQKGETPTSRQEKTEMKKTSSDKPIAAIRKEIENKEVKERIALPESLAAAREADAKQQKIESLRQRAIAKGKNPSGRDSVWDRVSMGAFQASMSDPNKVSVSEVSAMLGYLRGGKKQYGKNEGIIKKSLEGQLQHILQSASPERLAEIVKEADSPELRQFLSDRAVPKTLKEVGERTAPGTSSEPRSTKKDYEKGGVYSTENFADGKIKVSNKASDPFMNSINARYERDVEEEYELFGTKYKDTSTQIFDVEASVDHQGKTVKMKQVSTSGSGFGQSTFNDPKLRAEAKAKVAAMVGQIAKEAPPGYRMVAFKDDNYELHSEALEELVKQGKARKVDGEDGVIYEIGLEGDPSSLRPPLDIDEFDRYLDPALIERRKQRNREWLGTRYALGKNDSDSRA